MHPSRHGTYAGITMHPFETVRAGAACSRRNRRNALPDPATCGATCAQAVVAPCDARCAPMYAWRGSSRHTSGGPQFAADFLAGALPHPPTNKHVWWGSSRRTSEAQLAVWLMPCHTPHSMSSGVPQSQLACGRAVCGALLQLGASTGMHAWRRTTLSYCRTAAGCKLARAAGRGVDSRCCARGPLFLGCVPQT